jgi:hypothetical protein
VFSSFEKLAERFALSGRSNSAVHHQTGEIGTIRFSPEGGTSSIDLEAAQRPVWPKRHTLLPSDEPAAPRPSYAISEAKLSPIASQGWDGTCEIETGTEHVPSGCSGWEIGTQRTKIAEKADADYEKRSDDPLGLDMHATTFVFVTPRRWGQKRQWAAAKRGEAKWRDVRAYDADDLVHWIELYPAVGHWLAVALGKRPIGAQQLEEVWEEWSLSTQLPLSTDLILAGRDEEAAKVLRWLREDASVLSIQARRCSEATALEWPRTSAVLGQIAESYEHEGTRHDEDTERRDWR